MSLIASGGWNPEPVGIALLILSSGSFPPHSSLPTCSAHSSSFQNSEQDYPSSFFPIYSLPQNISPLGTKTVSLRWGAGTLIVLGNHVLLIFQDYSNDWSPSDTVRRLRRGKVRPLERGVLWDFLGSWPACSHREDFLTSLLTSVC